MAVGVVLFFYTVTVCFIICAYAYPYQTEGIVAAVAGLAVLVVGIILLSTSGERQPLQPQPYPPPPMVYYQPPVAAPVRAGARNFCPVCGTHYPPEYNVCPRDSSPLKPMQ